MSRFKLKKGQYFTKPRIKIKKQGPRRKEQGEKSKDK